MKNTILLFTACAFLSGCSAKVRMESKPVVELTREELDRFRKKLHHSRHQDVETAFSYGVAFTRSSSAGEAAQFDVKHLHASLDNIFNVTNCTYPREAP